MAVREKGCEGYERKRPIKRKMKGLADNEYYFIKLWFDLQENKLKKLFLAGSGSKTIHLDWAKSVFFVSA